MSRPIILVPGFWLGAWAWDDVAGHLRDAGHDVTALTLPGLDSPDTDRSQIRLSDHTDTIVAAVEAAGEPVVLAVHSGAGYPGHEATDRVPDRIAHMIYVDSAAPVGAMNPDFEGDEYPLPPADELAENENLDGISEEQLQAFRDRAVPQPGGTLRDAITLENEARLDVPTTVIATAFTSEQYQAYAKEGYGFLAGLNDLRNLSYVDLPTSHWPMWSRPKELAKIIGDIASA